MDDELLSARRGDADGRHVIVEDETLAQGFTQIPNGVLRRPDLQPGAKLTYMVLLSYAWNRDQVYPGQDRLAVDMGVSERSVRTYLDQLEKSGLISVEQRGLGRTNVYTLHRLSGAANSAGQPRPENIAGQDRKQVAGQERQNLPGKNTKREEYEGEDDSKGRAPVRMIPARTRATIENYIGDYAIELNDQAPIASSVTRAINIFSRAGVSIDQFSTAMQEAKLITQQSTPSIKASAPDGTKAKMAFFFETLARRVGVNDQSKAGD